MSIEGNRLRDLDIALIRAALRPVSGRSMLADMMGESRRRGRKSSLGRDIVGCTTVSYTTELLEDGGTRRMNTGAGIPFLLIQRS